jgi:superoxide dismutase, Fe-Mn family
MKTFTPKTFNIPELKGISKKTIDGHIKLYEGYVKHANLINEKIAEMSKDTASAEANSYAINETQRRFAFEFDGMKNHEYYFEQFEGHLSTPNTLPDNSSLKAAIEEEWGSFDAWLARFIAIGLTRGIGWAILSYDKTNGRLVQTWVDEQHLGQLSSTEVILALDMWEHSYLLDYIPSEKKKYIEAVFENLNWGVVEGRFVKATAATK